MDKENSTAIECIDSTDGRDRISEKLQILRNDLSKPFLKPLEVSDIAPYVDGMDDLSDEQKDALANRLFRYSGGVTYTSVLVCNGIERCPYRPDCPLEPNYPVGIRCPLERALADRWYDEYFKSLKVDPGNRTETGMLQTLVSIELQLMRANAELSYKGLQQPVYKTGQNGETFIEMKQNNLIATIQKLNDQKVSLFKSFAATRDGKNDRQTKDPSQILKEAFRKARGAKK